MDAGVSKTEIARRYNAFTGAVFNLIYLYQLKDPIIKKAPDVERIIAAFKQGKKQRKIAEVLNYSTKVLDWAIKELNVKRSRSAVMKTTSFSIHKNLIKELYLQDLSGNEIAEWVYMITPSVYAKVWRVELEWV